MYSHKKRTNGEDQVRGDNQMIIDSALDECQKLWLVCAYMGNANVMCICAMRYVI